MVSGLDYLFWAYPRYATCSHTYPSLYYARPELPIFLHSLITSRPLSYQIIISKNYRYQLKPKSNINYELKQGNQKYSNEQFWHPSIRSPLSVLGLLTH